MCNFSSEASSDALNAISAAAGISDLKKTLGIGTLLETNQALFPRHSWRWCSFSRLVGYVSSLQGNLGSSTLPPIIMDIYIYYQAHLVGRISDSSTVVESIYPIFPDRATNKNFQKLTSEMHEVHPPLRHRSRSYRSGCLYITSRMWVDDIWWYQIHGDRMPKKNGLVRKGILGL